MLLQPIRTWLQSDQDYAAGLKLLRDTGYTGFALTVLSMGEDAYTRKRLEKELRGWLDQNNVSAAAPVLDPGPTRCAEDSLPPVVYKVREQEAPYFYEIPEPEELKALRDRKGKLLDQRAEIKARLRVKMDEGNSEKLIEERRQDALDVKAITRQIDEIVSQLEFYEQYGYLPPLATDPAVLVDDAAALLNVRSYVSRYKAKLKKKNLTPEQRDSAEKLLKQYSDEKSRLEQKLSKSQS